MDKKTFELINRKEEYNTRYVDNFERYLLQASNNPHQFKPLRLKECYPNQKIKLDPKTFCELCLLKLLF